MAIIQKINRRLEYANGIAGLVGGNKVIAHHGYIKVAGVKSKVYENVPDNLIGLFESTPPTNWNLADGTNGTVDLISENLFLRGGASQGTATGSNTHSHSITGTTGWDTPRFGSSGLFSARKAPTHRHTYNHTHGSTPHIPAYYQMIPAVSQNANKIPAGTILFYDRTGSITGWTEFTGANNKFFRMSSTSGDSSHSGMHEHSYSGNSSSVGTGTYSGNGYSYTPYETHYHSIAHSHSLITNLPPNIRLRAMQASTDIYWIPAGIVAFFLSNQVPDGWEVYDPAQGQFIRLSTTPSTTVQGSSTHSHASQGFTTGVNSGASSKNAGTSGSSYPAQGHKHSFSHGHGATTNNNIPRHISLLICRKL